MNLDKAIPLLGTIPIKICDDVYEKSKRYLEPRDWHGGCANPHADSYRVQKKWDKQYGTHKVKAIPDGEASIWHNGHRAIMNSAAFAQWQEKLK